MADYDPWHEVSRFAGLTVVEAPLPPRLRGLIDFENNTITLSSDLLPVEQRCTLAHELVHAERGPVLMRHTAREEAAVSAIAARRLIPLDELTEALRWSDDAALLAHDLGVDARTVRIRLRTLTDAERGSIRRRLGDRVEFA